MRSAIPVQERPARNVLTAASKYANHTQKPLVYVTPSTACPVFSAIKRNTQSLSQRTTDEIKDEKPREEDHLPVPSVSADRHRYRQQPLHMAQWKDRSPDHHTDAGADYRGSKNCPTLAVLWQCPPCSARRNRSTTAGDEKHIDAGHNYQQHRISRNRICQPMYPDCTDSDRHYEKHRKERQVRVPRHS